jgi:RimJ/RimL family protein N-acetyltransferase
MTSAPRLSLLDATVSLLDSAIRAPHSLTTLLHAEIASGWEGFPEALPILRDACAAAPESQWGTVLFVLNTPRTLVGMGGYKGAPSVDGLVEIGYAIAPAHQRRGLATEAARALVERAFMDSSVAAVEAQTLAEHNASSRVLEKLGMKRIGELYDAENGALWHWRLARQRST